MRYSQSGSRCKTVQAGTTYSFLPPSTPADRHPAQIVADPTRELQVPESLHLPRETPRHTRTTKPS